MAMEIRSILILSGLLLSVGFLEACAPKKTAPPHEGYVLKVLSNSVVSAPYEEDLPSPVRTRTIVPWDEVAILEVQPEGTPEAGALVVRYGKSWWESNGGGPWRVYLLEAAGPAIEPISIQWQPKSGSSFRAIARVDGAARRYDFDL